METTTTSMTKPTKPAMPTKSEATLVCEAHAAVLAARDALERACAMTREPRLRELLGRALAAARQARDATLLAVGGDEAYAILAAERISGLAFGLPEAATCATCKYCKDRIGVPRCYLNDCVDGECLPETGTCAEWTRGR